MRSDVLRYRLLEILEKEGPMNTCQVCRRIHGRGKNDMVYCRGSQPRKIVQWGGNDCYLNPKGGVYPNCGVCSPPYRKVYRNLHILVKRGRIKTEKIRFKDPQKKGRNWDTMRFWGVDLSPILKQTMPFYLAINGS